MPASFLPRRSPLLLLAAALVALAAFVAPSAQPAQAQATTVWSATLTVVDYGGGREGCDLGLGPRVCSLRGVVVAEWGQLAARSW